MEGQTFPVRAHRIPKERPRIYISHEHPRGSRRQSQPLLLLNDCPFLWHSNLPPSGKEPQSKVLPAYSVRLEYFNWENITTAPRELGDLDPDALLQSAPDEDSRSMCAVSAALFLKVGLWGTHVDLV